MAVALEGNNPGGINNGSYAKSQPGYTGANGRYAAFDTLQHGFDAEVNLLQHSYLEKGINTPTEIAHKYAPAADGNSEAAYAQAIASGLGIGLNDTIAPSQAGQLALIQAKHENSTFDPSKVTINGTPGALASAGAAPSVTLGDVFSGKASLAQYAASATGISGALAAIDAAVKNMAIRGGAVLLALVLIAFGLYYLANDASSGALNKAAGEAMLAA